jgi:sugar/nucleoside kinase (ribokinase family)
MKTDVYLYGMTCLSTIHVLDGDYPPPDSYREIKQTYVIPSGETGNAALLLAHFGLSVKMDGPRLGAKTKGPILDFYSKRGVDCRGFTCDPDFPGVEDLVLVDSRTRTIFGAFGRFLFGGERRWSSPDRRAVAAAAAVSLDPFLREESRLAAEYCRDERKPYVTIDLPPDDFIHRHASVTVVSDEFTRREYPGTDVRAQFRKYAENSSGLVVFTFGAKEILFGRRGGEIRTFTPFRVDSKGSLAAGDFFRGGTVYALQREWPDEKIVAFGAATGALACTHFPAALNLPSLESILELAESGERPV